jgi:sortase A
MNRKRGFWPFLIVRTIANSLIISGIVFSFLSFSPFIMQELRYWWRTNILASSTYENILVVPKTEKKELVLPPLSVTPKDTNFGIVIEKVEVNAPVVPNVNAGIYREYMAALNKGAAHARGTAFPGSTAAENNNVFIFAHSAADPIFARRYNSVFYLLRKLEVGDRISTFYQGKRFDYLVSKKEVVQASDTQYLTQASKEPILTLQTCDPPGSSLRRLIITAKLVQ